MSAIMDLPVVAMLMRGPLAPYCRGLLLPSRATIGFEGVTGSFTPGHIVKPPHLSVAEWLIVFGISMPVLATSTTRDPGLSLGVFIVGSSITSPFLLIRAPRASTDEEVSQPPNVLAATRSAQRQP